jgi:hypothetical protein
LTSPLIVKPAAHLRRFIGGFNAPHHRNASLSSGFYIVRKVLPLIRLTTALAHCSLFWPVCAVTEAAAPNKKGHHTAVSPVHSSLEITGKTTSIPGLPVVKLDDRTEDPGNPEKMPAAPPSPLRRDRFASLRPPRLSWTLKL